MSWVNTAKITLMFTMFSCFFYLKHTIFKKFLSRSVFCVCRKYISLKENLLIARPPMLRAIWTLLVSSAPHNPECQPESAAASVGSGHRRTATADGAQHGAEVQTPTPARISQQWFHMSQARISNFSPSINEDWQEVMQHNSTDGAIITYDIVQ